MKRILIFLWIGISSFTLSLAFADLPRTLYAINGSAETVSKLALDSQDISQNIAQTGQIPHKIMVKDGKLYILDSGTSDIKILDPKTDQIVRTIALLPGANPWDMEFVDVNRVYVTNWVANTVSVVDINSGTILQDIPVGKGPEDIFVLEDQVFVTNSGYAGWGVPYEQGSIMKIDLRTNTVVDTLAVPINPQKIAQAPDGNLHVLCTGDYETSVGQIAVIDVSGAAVVDTIRLGGAPGDLEITAEGKAYAVDWGDEQNSFLYAYDALSEEVTHAAENPIKIGPNTSQIYYDARENCLWIPYMRGYGGDGFVQKYDVALDSVVWISDVLGNGTERVTVLEEISADVKNHDKTSNPNHFMLDQNYPNPFNPDTRITFELSEARQISLDIFNTRGQRIRTLLNSQETAGQHVVVWDGNDENHLAVSSGVYVARLVAGKQVKTIKMMLMR